MAKLFFTFLILGLMGIVVYVVYRLIKSKMDSYSAPTMNSPQNIDMMIESVKNKINLAQLQVESGMYEAEEDLKRYKEDLKKLKNLQSKIK